jgi:hypothetical protein
LRRTPLTDLLANHAKLDTLKLHTPKFHAPNLSTLKLSGLGLRGKRTLAYGGATLALVGITGVTAATAASAAPTTAGIAGASHRIGAADAADVQFGSRVSLQHGAASPSFAAFGTPIGGAGQPGAAQAASGSGHVPVLAGAGFAQVAAGVGHAQAPASTGHVQVAASSATAAAPARPAPAPHVVRHGTARTWQQIQQQLASQTTPRAAPGQLPPTDQLMTGPASGPQSYLPIGPSQMANATAIVQQALNMHMGLRASVIAVATAMQESGLQNINYGDSDSLGLFQQRPSMGWGTAAQITTPSYAAGAFLNALAQYQRTDPGWAAQPLWATAQAVQKSGFPYAYAKWESQAAQLVTSIATRLA